MSEKDKLIEEVKQQIELLKKEILEKQKTLNTLLEKLDSIDDEED